MSLMEDIRDAFSSVHFPAEGDIVDYSLQEGDYGGDIVDELERWRCKPPSVELLRKMHQELRKLTAAASLWLLPAYLCYALTEEAKYSRMEISFFILSLAGHGAEDDSDIKRRLSLMNDLQFSCVERVLEYLMLDHD